MKKETEVGKIGYLLFCDGTQCKRCLNAFICRELRGLNEKDIQDICDNLEMKIMRALPQNMRDLAAKLAVCGGDRGMTEREKMIEILKQTSDLWKEEESHGYIVSVDLGKIADTLIEARIRDITERGWIFMNGEAIVPTPEIYNKVAELLGCPKISQEGSND